MNRIQQKIVVDNSPRAQRERFFLLGGYSLFLVTVGIVVGYALHYVVGR